MTIKEKILSELYGADYFEYLRLDQLLYDFNEGEYLSKSSLYGSLEAGDRCADKLLRDGYIKDCGTSMKITSEGLLFRAAGGYTREFLKAKRATIGFLISIISFLIACASFVISLTR